MKAFSILRYLKQFSIWILLCTLAGVIGIYSFGNSRQEYTASAMIKYTNSGAADGYTPDGSPIDVEEIYCSSVISSVIQELELHDSLDDLRSKCYVKEVIPEEQQTINEVLLEKGEEPTYFPDTYTVYFVADNTKSAEYARDVLDAVIKNYCTYYTEKYIEQQLLPNGTADLTGKDYDFIETAGVLESTTLEMLNYLEQKKTFYPGFRASQTGYSYTDLYDIYTYLYNYGIPNLYAMILSDAQSKDVEVLAKRLTNEVETYQLSIRNRESQIEYLTGLIDNFTERNKEMMDYHYHDQVANSQSDYILKDVDKTRDESDKETTYDSLLQQYVDLKTACENDRIALEHDQYLLSVFDQLLQNPGAGSCTGDQIQQALDSYTENLNTYFELVDGTSRELNSHLSVNYLQMLSTVRVSNAINVKLYTLLAFVLFLIIGCGGAVVFGRGADFLDYLLYVDKVIGLPNRIRCDLFIDDHAKRLLPEQYSFFSISFDSLQKLSSEYGRSVGDAVMKDFAAILKSIGEAYGFVGYNGSGQFFAFLPDCSPRKAQTILTALDNQVREYNQINPGRDIRYTAAFANSTEDATYDLRALIRLGIRRGQGKRQTEQAEQAEHAQPQPDEHVRPEQESQA